MRVLHVVESYGAGTASALVQYVRATPEIEHHLVRRLRHDDDHADDGELSLFALRARDGARHGPRLRSVRSAVKAVAPDVVHGHSSFGGAFARLAAGRRPIVVHTPHCYATERQDLGRPARAAYEVAERLLSYNTQVVAGCSERETALGRGYAPQARHVFVPNVSDLTAEGVERADPPVVTAHGPARPTSATRSRSSTSYAAWTARRSARWIGDGDDTLKQALTDGGVEVTGWLPRSEAIRLLGESTVYVHTARWDGAPMTMIEAHALGLPQVAIATRGRPSPDPRSPPSTEELARALDALLADPDGARRQPRRLGRLLQATHTVERQRAALLEAYGAAAP